MNPDQNEASTTVIDRQLALNGTVLWLRVIVTSIATILTTRYALLALGIDGFGVYAATAAIPLAFSFVNAAMLVTTQRMLNIETKKSEFSSLFSASLGLHFLIGVLILIAGLSLGPLILARLLDIPPNLEESAGTVLQLTVIAASIGASLVPYEALFHSKERFTMLAILDTIRACTVLTGTYWLVEFDGNRLIGYAVITSVGSVATSIVIGFFALCLHQESRPRRGELFNSSVYKSQTTLFGWNIFGALAAVARQQGFILLSNIFFGPTGSAAFGIASQLAGAIRQMVSAITTAITPRIFQAESTKGHEHAIDIAFASAKYASFGVLLLSVPLIAEIETVLVTWLSVVPDLTIAMTTLVVMALAIDQLSSPVGIAHLATGRIARYQLICGLTTILAIPVAYLVGLNSGNPSYILMVLVLTSTIVAILRVVLLRNYTSSAVGGWLSTTVTPTAKVMIPAILSATAVITIVPPSLARLALTTFVSTLVIVYMISITGLNKSERASLQRLTWRGLE